MTKQIMVVVAIVLLSFTAVQAELVIGRDSPAVYLWDDNTAVATCGSTYTSSAVKVNRNSGGDGVTAALLIAFANTCTQATSNEISITYEVSYDGTNFYAPVKPGDERNDVLVENLTPLRLRNVGYSRAITPTTWVDSDAFSYCGPVYAPTLTAYVPITDTFYTPYVRFKLRNSGTAASHNDVILFGR